MEISRRRSVLGDISTSTRMFSSIDSESNLILMQEELLTRTPSLEEQIIRQRGTLRDLRQSPLGINFLDDSENESFPVTPIKGLPLQTRKRLLMTPPHTTLTPKNDAKKARISRKSHPVPLKLELEAYSASQLVDMIDKMVLKHPELEQEVRESMGTPDLKDLETHLKDLSRSVYKAFPRHRWGSSRDAYCYKRVRLHIDNFKKTCLKQGRILVKSQNWESVVNYVIMANRYTDQLPVWDEPSHNDAKKKCQRCLAAHCLIALKKAPFEKETLRDFCDKLKPASLSNPDLMTCVAQIESSLLLLP